MGFWDVVHNHTATMVIGFCFMVLCLTVVIAYAITTWCEHSFNGDLILEEILQDENKVAELRAAIASRQRIRQGYKKEDKFYRHTGGMIDEKV